MCRQALSNLARGDRHPPAGRRGGGEAGGGGGGLESDALGETGKPKEKGQSFPGYLQKSGPARKHLLSSGQELGRAKSANSPFI